MRGPRVNMDAWDSKNCCICFSRRTGTLILGYLSSIASLVALAVLSWIAITEAYSCPHSRFRSCSLGGYFAFLCVGISLSLLHGVFSVLLVVGTHKEKPRLMIPYMVLFAILLILNIIRFFVGIIASLVYGPFNFPLFLSPIVVNFIIFSIQYHFFCVIRAHYRELKGGFDHEHLVESPECDANPMESKEPLPKPEEIKVPQSVSVDFKPPAYEP